MASTPLSYSHDLTRDEIIARYRDQIATDKRSKLGKSDLEQLISILIDRLKTMDDRLEIKALCETEIALLEEGYKTSTVAFDYLPKYRKAVEKAIADEMIPVTKNNSHQYIHTQRVTGAEEERFEHYALSYLKYDVATYENLDTRSKETNRDKQLNLKEVNPHLYLDKLQQLLYSDDKFASRHQAIAIAGLTGRRLNEVLARGKFSLAEHPYLLKFEGHSKVEREAYDIVTLVEAAQLLPIIEQFRESDEVQPLLTLTNDELVAAINKFDVQINRECNKYLAEIVPPLEGREAVSIHNLRSLWGAIAASFFCPPTSHEYPFLQHYLGHAIDSAATGHYFRYRLVDEYGNFLSNRGVMIAQFGELPIPHSQQFSVNDDEAPSRLETEAIASSIEETAEPTGTEAEAIRVEAVSVTKTETTDEQSALRGQESDSRLLSLLPSLTDNPLARNLRIPLTELLNSDRYTHLLTGLMAVTGRMAGELLKSRKFYPHPDEAFALLFSSTITTSYDRLVTLVEGKIVLDVLNRLKSHTDVQPLLYLSPNEINNRCLSHVTKTLLSHLPFRDIDEMIVAYQTLVGTDEPHQREPQPEKLKRPATTIYNLYSDDRQRLEVIASFLGIEGTQAAVFHSLLDWVEGQLNKDATPVETPPDKSLQAITEQAKTLTWLTNEITSLREWVAALELERDDLKSQLEQASTPDPQVEALQSENDRLSQELDKANSTLSVFRQLLNNDEDVTPKRSMARARTPELTVVTELKAAIASQSVQPSQTEVPKAIAISEPQEKKHRRPRHDGGAKARAISIWSALQQWNGLHPDNTFALTPALLEVTFHIHRQAAKDFINECREQIEHHHTAIGATTIRTHNRGKDIEPFKAFVEQFG